VKEVLGEKLKSPLRKDEVEERDKPLNAPIRFKLIDVAIAIGKITREFVGVSKWRN